jgi:hypothetical protein
VESDRVKAWRFIPSRFGVMSASFDHMSDSCLINSNCTVAAVRSYFHRGTARRPVDLPFELKNLRCMILHNHVLRGQSFGNNFWSGCQKPILKLRRNCKLCHQRCSLIF